MKRILMIAAHYPPMKGSSGLQRSLKFSEYLPEYDWNPIVLTINRRVHINTSTEQLGEIPDSIITRSAFALDARRHLSMRGRYLKRLALPDRWSTWWLGAVPMGLQLIRKYKPQIIWSTFPIATAHMIGHSLSKWSGIPWVADFRDSMTEDNYPVDPDIRRSVLRVERKTVHQASRCVFTTPSTMAMYAQRYPSIPTSRWSVISNGFDEENFAQSMSAAPPKLSKSITLLHSGLLDPGDRDPTQFFQALRILKDEGCVSGDDVEIRLRATAFDSIYERQILEFGIEDIVRLCSSVSYKEALSEMMSADGLMLFQGVGCNHQIPAKVYEYFRAGRPILGLTSPQGDTGKLLRDVGVTSVAALEDTDSMVPVIRSFVASIRAGQAVGIPAKVASGFTRFRLTEMLASTCDEIISL
jgi:hypothetical protein